MDIDIYMDAARKAICRGSEPGKPIPKCRCFKDGAQALLARPNCRGACEDAVEFVAKAIAEAVRSSRNKVIEMCAKVADTCDGSRDNCDDDQRWIAERIAASIRAIKSREVKP